MRSARKTLSIIALLPLCLLAQQQTPSHPPAASSPSPTMANPQAPVLAKSPALPCPERPNSAGGSIQTLSDIKGVDFRFYLVMLKKKVQEKWDSLIPSSALGPESKCGQVVLRFSILPDGGVRVLRIEKSSGDESLDRAAYDAIASSSPFGPLPKKFVGNLDLRTNFFYNPQKAQRDSGADNNPKPELHKDSSHPAQ